MLVRERMSRNLLVTTPDRPLAEVRSRLSQRRCRQMPVLDGDRLVGIVTDRDLRSASPASTLKQAMTREVLVIAPQASVDEAARVLRRRKINALPVVDGEHLVGIITASDILDAFIQLSGVAESSYRLVLSGARSEKALRQIRAIVESHGGELRWTYVETGGRRGSVHVRIRSRRLDELTAALEAAGFEVAAIIATRSEKPRRPRGGKRPSVRG